MVYDPLFPQKEAARPDRHCWVSASAGTGKTKVLIDRILNLLLSGVRPQSILCLTFTNAAADEMRSRLIGFATYDIDSLRHLCEERHIVPRIPLIRVSENLRFLAENPEIFHVRTLHSFCQYLIQRFSEEGSTQQRVLTDIEIPDYLAEAREHVFCESSLYSCFELVAKHLSECRFLDLLNSFFENSFWLMSWRQTYPTLEIYEKRLMEEMEIDTPLRLDTRLSSILQNIAHDEGLSDKEKKWMGDVSEALQNDVSLIPFFLTQTGAKRKNFLRVATLQKYPDILSFQENILQCHDYEKSLILKDLNHAFFKISLSVFEIYQNLKRERNTCDFNDLIDQGIELLSSHRADVLAALEPQLEHILIDEAQDTSFHQWVFLHALIELFIPPHEGGKTLFIVGDPKQSIYSFQGARPEIFEALPHYWRNFYKSSKTPFCEIGLHHSFRSTDSILKGVENTFLRSPLPLPAYLKNCAHTSARLSDSRGIHLWPLSDEENHAENLSTWIEALLDSHRILPSTRSPIQASDILILTQKRSPSISLFLQEMRRRGHKIGSHERTRLCDVLPLCDLLALGRFAFFPKDDYSFACVLRSPLIHQTWSEVDLFTLLKQREDKSCWVFMKDLLWPEDRLFLEDLIEKIQTLSPVGFLNYTRERHFCDEYLEALISWIHLYQGRYDTSLLGWLEWLKRSNPLIPSTPETGGMRLLTVHGSKGLQSPIVILADATQTPRASQDLFLIQEDPFLWLIKPPSQLSSHLCESIKEKMRTRMMEEHQRLLYVALTRAQDEIYLTGIGGAKSWYAQIQEAFP